MAIGTERKVYRQHRGWHAFLEAPACPREAISPQKRAAKHFPSGVYGTSSNVDVKGFLPQQPRRQHRQSDYGGPHKDHQVELAGPPDETVGELPLDQEVVKSP